MCPNFDCRSWAPPHAPPHSPRPPRSPPPPCPPPPSPPVLWWNYPCMHCASSGLDPSTSGSWPPPCLAFSVFANPEADGRTPLCTSLRRVQSLHMQHMQVSLRVLLGVRSRKGLLAPTHVLTRHAAAALAAALAAAVCALAATCAATRAAEPAGTYARDWPRPRAPPQRGEQGEAHGWSSWSRGWRRWR